MPELADWSRLALPEDSEIHALLHVCPDIVLVRFRDEELLVRAGEESLEIFLVVRGSCLVENTQESGQISPATRQPGAEVAVIEASPSAPVFVGEMAYLGGGRRTASVRSVLASWALRLKPEHLDRILGSAPPGFPQLTRVLCRQFTRRLAEMNAQLRYYQLRHALNAEQRFLSPGEMLCEAGAPADALFQLIAGQLTRETSSGVEHITPNAQGPMFLDPKAYFTGGRHMHTLRAETHCVLLAIDAASKAAVVRNYPEEILSLLD